MSLRPRFYKIGETLHQSAPLLAESAKVTLPRGPEQGGPVKKQPPDPGTYTPYPTTLRVWLMRRP